MKKQAIVNKMMTVRTYLSVGFLDRIITPRKRYKRYKKKDFDEGVGEA